MKKGKGELGKTKKYTTLANNVKKISADTEPLPRLSFERIKRIYDEYGFAPPNVGEVQSSMPNDEQKLRKLLEQHRKVLDEEVKSRAGKKIADMKYQGDIYKQNQKNHLDTMKAQAKMAKQGGMPMAGGATGGPGMAQGMPQMQMPQPAQPMAQGDNVGGEEMLPPGMAPNQQPLDISNTSDAFFVGEFALVKLVNPGVQSDKSPIWLVDVKNKVLRPFMSQKSFDTYFGASQEAYDAIVVLPSSAVSEGGPLGTFKMMNSEFGVKEDGTMRELDHSPAMIQRRYGKPVDEAAENRSVMALDGMFKKLKSGGGKPQPEEGMHEMPGGEMMPDAEMQGGATGGPGYKYDGTGGPGVASLNISRSLEPGMTGADVKSLQDWLKAQGFLKIGNTTEYYGDMTKAAVAAWQKSIGLDAGQYPGYFGPRSLAKAQAITPPTPTEQPGSPVNVPGTYGGSAAGATKTGLPYNQTNSVTSEFKNSVTSDLAGALNAAPTITTVASSQIEKIKQDPTLLAFYLSALTYGGYTMGEVFKDMKRRELIASGRTDLENTLVISGDKTREEWAQDDKGRLANTLPEFAAMKPGLNNIDPSIFNLPLFDVPDELFKQLIPVLDPTTPEFKAEIEKIQSVMHDVQVTMINAKTEQEKSAAEFEYNKFKEIINKTYGIQLSNNAQEAWKQVETIGTNYGQAGISNSGMQNEAVDDMLKKVRQGDSISRDKKLTEEEAKKVTYYSKFGTPEEIKNLIAEDQAKGLPRDQWRATQWGLVPSQEVLNSLDLAAMKQKFPGMTDEELQNKRSMVLDQFGNYRSDLYQTKTNSLETERVANKADQESIYTKKGELAEQKRTRELNVSTDPHLRTKVNDTPTTGTTPPNPEMPKTPVPTATNVSSGTQLQPGVNYTQLDALSAQIKKASDSLAGKTITPTITASKPVTPTPITPAPITPNKKYNTLNDYYSANGGYNTWNSTKRQSDAKAAGIINYKGTTSQNEQLLKSLRGY